MRLDARVEVRVVAAGAEGSPARDVALIRLGGAPEIGPPGWAALRDLPEGAAAGHEANCRCCAGRSGLADMMMQLFAERAKDQIGFFRAVFVSVPSSLVCETVTILAHDPVIAGRYRVDR
ncbi:hypothetical protein NFI95_06895 [Acetobacteraceae bacterium KSS8]|uniref:Uncharacterized protein n=1 Tax=Endosaccharibacter trunci TaxID=2812733 RepID=A0ABT1W5L4_9PROT|nr:hypothetical protein [Acetobacteraceae bacterium KSS8]